MRAFFDEYAQTQNDEALGSRSQNDTSGVCRFCGYASDDVMLGVCGACVVEDASDSDEGKSP